MKSAQGLTKYFSCVALEARKTNSSLIPYDGAKMRPFMEFNSIVHNSYGVRVRKHTFLTSTSLRTFEVVPRVLGFLILSIDCIVLDLLGRVRICLNKLVKLKNFRSAALRLW